MITQKPNRFYGRPWQVRIGRHYVGSFALVQQAKAAEQEALDFFKEHGHYPKISSREYIPKRWAPHIKSGMLIADNVVYKRSLSEQRKIDKRKSANAEKD